MTKTKFLLFASAVIILVITGILLLLKSRSLTTNPSPTFSGESSYQFVVDQVNFGPRIPGSTAHQLTRQYIEDKLNAYGWEVELQSVEFEGHQVFNVIGRRGTQGKVTLIGAHYDSRLYASEETSEVDKFAPVPGANDGASGVAVLLELARTLPPLQDQEIWLVFFDVEDQGRIEGWDWIIGSRAFVANINEKPDRAVILDMIGDTDLQVYREKGSDPSLTDEIWKTAARLGFAGTFIDQSKYAILDDHLPFIEAGIPAVDIIDFDYPYYHTLEDTSDKVSPGSLEIIGLTIAAWLQGTP